MGNIHKKREKNKVGWASTLRNDLPLSLLQQRLLDETPNAYHASGLYTCARTHTHARRDYYG